MKSWKALPYIMHAHHVTFATDKTAFSPFRALHLTTMTLRRLSYKSKAKKNGVCTSRSRYAIGAALAYLGWANLGAR